MIRPSKNIVVVGALLVALSSCSAPAAVGDGDGPEEVRVQDYHPNTDWNCKVFTHDKSTRGASIAVWCKQS